MANEEKIRKNPFNREDLKKLLGIFRFVLPYRLMFITGMVCLVLGSLSLLAFPFLAGKLIDAASGGENWITSDLGTIALFLGLVLLLQGIFAYFRVYLFASVNERSMADLRNGLYSKYITLPVSIFDSMRTGEMISRITSDISLLQDSFSITLAELIRQVIILLAGIIIIFVAAPKLSLFTLAILPVVVLLALIFGRYIKKLSKATQEKLSQANIIVEETLQSARIVKAFTNELLEIGRYKKSLNQVVKTALRMAGYRAWFIAFIIFALFGTMVAVLWFGSVQVQQGNISVGELLSFVLYTTFIGGSIAGLGDIYSQVQKAIGASERIIEILNMDGEEVLENPDFNKSQGSGKIEFRNIHFTYPARPDQLVLKGVDLIIEPGEKVAFVGHSGAGKSTIIQLLLRYYNPDSGNIYLDERAIDDIALSEYRNYFGIVPQEIFLFGGSIKENVLYGKPGAGDVEIKSALKKANAWEFVTKLPEQMDTVVGERGVTLSGGQRQRIAIARAILRDPVVLILDEATSSLDTHSEKLVQEAIISLMENRTTIIIAHRLSTVKHADRIYVISEGDIVEKGNHDDLMAKNDGIYAHLAGLQLR